MLTINNVEFSYAVKGSNIVVFGATVAGMLLATSLFQQGKKVLLFDNDEKKHGDIVGVECQKPKNMGDDWTYIVAANSLAGQHQIIEEIYFWGVPSILTLTRSETKLLERDVADDLYLRCLFKSTMGIDLDLNHPRTFNEKLQWLKIYDRKPEYTIMVDKYAVKQYVANKIGDEYIIPALGVYDSFDEIDFEKLPDQFVLKCTHDSGSVIVCRDKKIFDKKSAKKSLETALSKNYFYPFREWPYKNVPPRIMAEKFIENEKGEILVVFKVMCFNGVPRIIQVIQNDKTAEETIDYFNTDWELLDIKQNFPNSKIHLHKPPHLKEMLSLAEILSKGTHFLRVDFYEHDKHPLFSEFTFFSDAGLAKFIPDKWDLILGEYIKL